MNSPMNSPSSSRISACACVAAAAALICGCATVPPDETISPTANDSDAATIRAIESAARASGTRVYWVNPPKARTPQATPRTVASLDGAG